MEDNMDKKILIKQELEYAVSGAHNKEVNAVIFLKDETKLVIHDIEWVESFSGIFGDELLTIKFGKNDRVVIKTANVRDYNISTVRGM